MNSRTRFDQMIANRKPIFAYNPPGSSNIQLIRNVNATNGIGLVDLERLSKENASTLVRKCLAEIKDIFGIRITSEEQLQEVLNQFSGLQKLIVIIANFDITKKQLDEIKKNEIALLAEVISIEEAYKKKWAESFVIKGNEGAGRIGDETSFILSQQFSEAGLSFIVQGGIGFYTTPAVFAVGARAVILDSQLYLASDSPLSAKAKSFLAKIDATDTKIIGESTNFKYRVFAKLATKIVKEYLLKEKDLLQFSLDERTEKLQEILFANHDMYNSEDFSNILLPIGQDVTFAKILADKFSTIEGIIDGLLNQVKVQIKNAQIDYPFKKDSELAKDLGIKYSLIQGPMANVSESPEFAKIIAQEGALPNLALGSLFPNQTRNLIMKTKEILENLPFGCGIIGLEANAKARSAHISILRELKPSFCVVAAGTIDQAKEVMSFGIKTFLHTPSPAIFSEAIIADINYLVLEGQECGGHIGLLSSFVLWELSLHEIEKLKENIISRGSKVNVAFAGGIGERYSAAMVSVIASALPKLMNGAMWIGSAYILTEEIVTTGAVKPLYREMAVDAKKTMVLGETVNTRARSIPTPFAKEILQRELQRLKTGVSLKERKHAFERDNLGATRVAAIGEIWNPDGEDDKPNRFMPIDEKGQYEKGNYLIGQIVGSLRTVKTVHNLHKELIEESEKILNQKSIELSQRLNQIAEQIEDKIEEKSAIHVSHNIFEGEGVAIIGLGGIFPDAPNIETYWQNIVNGIYSIKEIPKKRWINDIDLFYSEDREAMDKTYAKIAASIDDFKFNSLEFKIPPKVALSMDKVQQIALVAAKEALIDANILGKDIENARTAVIIGNSMGGEIRIDYNRRVYLPESFKSIENMPSFEKIDKNLWKKIVDEVLSFYEDTLIHVNEDSMPGELSNVIAGRIANVFNLRGKNMTCDAACASSLAALNIAVKGLLDKEYDTVLCGGADCSLDPSTFVKFAKIGAISAEGSFPFDVRANGFVMGEGAGFCVLKRLSDAVKDGDKIYAVIRGLGASSDGKGKGITAPNPEGQRLAITRALEQAGITINDLQLIEAHGTSTSVGDVIEMQVLQEVAKNSPQGSIAIGSVKSQIGHLKSAAGIAALIKTALAIYKKQLPPSINFETPNPYINWQSSPFYVNTKPQPWNKPDNGPRIAGISAFGFGGTNYHTIIEEYIPDETVGHLPKLFSPEEIQSVLSAYSTQKELKSEELVFDTNAWKESFEQRVVLETEAIFFGGKTQEELIKSLNDLKNNIPISSFSNDGSGLRIRDLANNSINSLKKNTRIGLTCHSFVDLPTAIDNALDGLTNSSKRLLLRNKGIFYSDDHKIGKVAFMFPGQGSQYVRMGRELWEKYEIVRETFREADEITEQMVGLKISDVIFAIGRSEKEAKELLKQTEITQPAIFVLDIAIFRLLLSYGIKPDFVVGHSLGEYAALVASGIFSLRDGLLAVVPRGKAMAQYDAVDKGTMASVATDYKTVEEILKEVDGYVIAANKNSPKQTVISGSTVAVKAAIEKFKLKGIDVVPLAVSAAFHSEIVAPAVSIFREAIEKLSYNKPVIPISSNVTGELYPETRKEIIDLLCKQIASPVEWMKQISSLYEDHGVRTFIEIGPKYVLTGFAKAILEDKKDILALASNHPKKGEMQHFNEVIAALGSFGYKLTLPDLNNSIYSEDFLTPQKNFYKKVSIEPLRYLSQSIISSPKIITKESPFDVLVNNELTNIIKDSSFKDYLKLQAPAISAFLKAGYGTYKDTIKMAIDYQKDAEKLEINTEAIGVTGVAIGLPGINRKVFDDSNFDAILAGQNFIDLIPMEIRDKMVDKNIVRLVKDAVKGAQFQVIDDVGEVIKLAAQKGEFDLTKEYGIDAEFVEILDITFQLAFAAGIEALKDAGIPLMPEKVITSIGKEISKGWVLPESLRDETGIVFASAFPAYSNLISTISQYLTDKFANKKKEEVIFLFDELIEQIKDKASQEKITNWFEANKERLDSDKESKFQFSRKFLFEILSMGHSQFAQFIRARGPNTQVNAACSSTTQAISIAEDWIRTGRCKRVIVIAADDVTNKEMLEWIGSGFLAVGAATTKDKVEEAALPFDNRRHGMIIGMGAVGMVLESDSTIQERGIKPIVDVLGTHIVNSAFHGTRLDRDHISTQTDSFISKIEKRFNISRDDIAKQLVFVSHETYTPARGGSASAEVDALRKTFGELADRIVIANTKGFTGHAMGAGIEDVVAVKILQKGIVPPVANWKELDPELGKLNLSKGGHYDVKYALRFAAGFGSQLTLALFRLNTAGDRFSNIAYENWLASLGGSRNTLEVVNKTLRMTEDQSIIKKSEMKIPQNITSTVSVVDGEVISNIIGLIAEKTGYPTEMIEPNMHLEEDLGIDTVKQAELFGILRTKYNLPREEGVLIQDYYSVNKIAEYLSSRLQGTSQVIQPVTSTAKVGNVPQKSEITRIITDLISEKTGYPTEMIEPNMELEEDLGIDTVKQAEIFGILRAKWNLPREEGILIQDYSTVTKITDYITKRIAESASTSSSSEIVTAEKKVSEIVPPKRFTLKMIETPKLKSNAFKLKGKKLVLVGDTGQFSKELKDLLNKKQVQIISQINLKKYISPEKLIDDLPKDEVDGLIFIESKLSKELHESNLGRFYFVLCRYLTFTEKPLIIAVNKNAVNFGWKQSKNTPEIGAVTGLTKALAREFSGGNIKTISSLEPKYVIEEIENGDGSVEIAYDEKGKRFVIITSEEVIDTKNTEQFTPTKDDLILIAGGAQGITFEITKKIVEKYQPKIAIFGRTSLPKNISELVALDQTGLASLKDSIIEALKKTEEKLTPVKIEREWSKTTKAIQIYHNIKQLHSLGSEVNYYSVDVTDAAKMKTSILKIIKEFDSPITGIIHGAGLEVSKLIHNKELADFNKVYDVKVLGYNNLVDNIDMKEVKFFINFSSVAGRYGNAGQVDYSAANDYLSKQTWKLREDGINATSICWSAWSEVGMATRGSVMTVLEHAGVTPIPLEEGVEAFIQELEYGKEPEVVIAGKLGVLLVSPLPDIPVDCRTFPMIGRVKRNFDGSLSAERVFSLQEDLYLDHHRFDSVPFLPGVMGLELFAELAKILYPKKVLKKFENVEFRSAIKFLKDQPRKLRSHITFEENPKVVIESDFIKDGKIIGEPKIHFIGELSFGKLSTPELIDISISKKDLIKKEVIYNILPHGSRFQVLESINKIERGIIAKSNLETTEQFSWKIKELIAQPLAIESAFQAMGLFDIIKDDRMGLPFQIEDLEFYNCQEVPSIIKGSKRGENDLGSIYDFEILAKDGQKIMKAIGYTTVKIQMDINLPEIEKIRLNQVENLFEVPKGSYLEIVNVNTLKKNISENTELIDKILHPQEFEKYQSLTVDKRRDEWLAGIYATKKAIMKNLPEIQMNIIKIEKDEYGKPKAFIGKVKKPYFVSITHSNGYAVSLISEESNIGIDLEIIEKRSDALIDELLNPKEQILISKQEKDIQEELITRIWTAKEAVSKVLGTGLNIDLHDLEISDVKDKKITIQIDPTKIPEKIQKNVNSKEKQKNIQLVANLSQNDEFVAAVCHLPK
ncbi:MAG TPA: SDR family NAD(P)-dependent oxidoreductase [candidate division Zixibacteria bacterium]|nr:SDR family NAD(P)-dependent oxidoreductase [candidate division Zixibacteria bacterium]